jgi:hypothetical protein
MRATTICAVHTAGTGSLADKFVSVMLHIHVTMTCIQRDQSFTFSPGRPMRVPLSFLRAPLTLSPRVAWRFW